MCLELIIPESDIELAEGQWDAERLLQVRLLLEKTMVSHDGVHVFHSSRMPRASEPHGITAVKLTSQANAQYSTQARAH